MSNKEFEIWSDKKINKLVNSEKGQRAEELFENFLNNSNRQIPFVRFDQEKNTYSSVLKNDNIKRPDYLICTKCKSFYIDVKYRTMSKHIDRFWIEIQDIIKLYEFQKEFHEEVWIALNKNLNKPEFIFTNISTIYLYYKKINEYYCTTFAKFPNSIYIPNFLLLYNDLSNDYGFYKLLDKTEIDKEINYINQKMPYYNAIISNELINLLENANNEYHNNQNKEKL